MHERAPLRLGRVFGVLGWLVAGALWAATTAGWALACSPPSPRPTVTTLPEGAVLLVGTTGELVAGGRLFYVERVYSGSVTVSPIVIAFKEGESIGDCSYPMSSGARLVIAPDQGPDGSLSADLVTLQAEPSSARGQELIAEARARYGEGVVPSGATAPVPATTGRDMRLLVAAAGVTAAVVVGVLVRRRRS